MNEQNDPIRLRHALIRLIAAVLAAVLLLALSGFGVFKLLRGGTAFTAIDEVQAGDYVEHDVYLNLGYFASGYRGETATEKYAVVPVNGQMVAFRFPSRWFASADTIQRNTASLLSGTAYSIDQYIRVTGTVKAMPEDVSSQLYSWFGKTKDSLEQLGLIGEVEDYADILPDVMICVDTVGSLSCGWVVAFSVIAALCLVYAIVVLVRIALKKYHAPDITVEITEAPEDEPVEEAETAEVPELEVPADEPPVEKEETPDEDA